MREAFKSFNFQPATWDLIEQANDIIDEYSGEGYVLTLRQLYYQFVARDLIQNTQQMYNRLGSIVNNARLAGVIDWSAIEDRTRNLQRNPSWDSPLAAMETLRKQYRTDLWANQEVRVEVWIEKEALVGVIERCCRELDVPYFACRGYVSQSEQWRAYRRILERANRGQATIILHLGDHDPSGIDMTRDNMDRLTMFLASQGFDECFAVQRIALNADQIERYRPPPNPAKMTDSRFRSYAARFGNKSWELDALEPRVIDDLVRESVMEVRNDDRWQESLMQMDDDLQQIDGVIDTLGAA